MQKFETPTLPKLRLERTKQPRGLQNVSLKDGGSITARIRNQKSSSFLPSAPAQPKHQNPPQHRRGYGFTGIVADSQPKTARVVSDSKLTPAPAPPAEPLTARPPTSDKSCPPRTGRHLRELPVQTVFLATVSVTVAANLCSVELACESATQMCTTMLCCLVADLTPCNRTEFGSAYASRDRLEYCG